MVHSSIDYCNSTEQEQLWFQQGCFLFLGPFWPARRLDPCCSCRFLRTDGPGPNASSFTHGGFGRVLFDLIWEQVQGDVQGNIDFQGLFIKRPEKQSPKNSLLVRPIFDRPPLQATLGSATLLVLRGSCKRHPLALCMWTGGHQGSSCSSPGKPADCCRRALFLAACSCGRTLAVIS